MPKINLSPYFSSLKNEQGIFLLLHRNGSAKKAGHIIYHSSTIQYTKALNCDMEYEFIAAFNMAGEVVPIKSLQENLL